jgi:regulator of protease activity HflC (stomatin/prohibitin superfamily)
MDKKRTPLIIAIVVIGIIMLFIFNATFIVLKPEERGIIFRKFSAAEEKLDKENVYREGFHVIAPWNEMYIYNILEQTREESLDILDKNGLSLKIDVTIGYNPTPERIGYLYEKFKMQYTQKLIIPEIRASVRRIAGQYSAEEIYSTKRKEVEDKISSQTRLVLERNNVTLNRLLIRSVTLPPKIKDAIELKLQQEQEMLAYKYKLEKETQEAERIRIAAEAEAAANRIIDASLSKNLLKNRGIEATLKLANSPNSKIVVIGGGEDGLPLILNDK